MLSKEITKPSSNLRKCSNLSLLQMQLAKLNLVEAGTKKIQERISKKASQIKKIKN